MAFDHYLTDGTIGADLTAAYSTAAFTVGALHDGSQGMYEFAQAAGVVGIAQAVIITSLGQAAEVTSTTSGATSKAIGVCLAAAGLADDEYGWFWRGCGACEIDVATTIAADAALTTTATAGVLGAGGDVVQSLLTTESSGSGSITDCYAADILTTN